MMMFDRIVKSPPGIAAEFGFSVGHILNDLCSSCWFTYLIIYLTDVKKESKNFAGILMLIGQFADGLATPLVGILIDKINCGYGRRKTWHAIGTICVAMSFGFIFNQCIGCETATTTVHRAYYGSFIVLFQFGWASTQISHLSLIPVIAGSPEKIIFLNSVRSGLTFVCGITVYLIMWLLLHFSASTDMDHLGPADAGSFANLSYIVISIGACFSFVFHFLVREPREGEKGAATVMEEEGRHLVSGGQKHTRRITDWFKIKKFYMVAVMYMFTRITVNVPQVYLPLYLTESLKLPKESIAYYPLMMLVCSVAGSFMCRYLVNCIGKTATYCSGAILVIASAFWFQFQTVTLHYTTYGATILIGCGGSIMLIMSLSMTADLIGVHSDTGAFVYGAMSFLDKISNGLTIAAIQNFHPEQCNSVSCASAAYYRYIMFLVPGGAAVCGAVSTLIILAGAYKCISRTSSHPTLNFGYRSMVEREVISNPTSYDSNDGDKI